MTVTKQVYTIRYITAIIIITISL